MKVLEHLRVITYHRRMVRKNCFRVGLYWQGLTHDLSKFSPAEFFVGAKYFQGDRSPNNAEREDRGYSAAWLHHKGRNKHHFEYWVDYCLNGEQVLGGMKMPTRFVVEMFMDRIAACRTYQKEAYTDESPLAYNNRALQVQSIVHPESYALLEHLLKMLAAHGEEVTFSYAKALLRKERQGIFRREKRG